MIEATNIKKSYQSGSMELPILKGCSFQLESGKSMAILGRSGSGKSTLLSIISGLLACNEGSILVDDTHIESLPEDKLCLFRAQNFGYIFQSFQLISYLTAQENVMFPLELLSTQSESKLESKSQPQSPSFSRKQIEEKAADCLTRVGLKDRLDHFPTQLSGGEKQRVGIARALATQPKIIFADEPSGNLDDETSNQVMPLLFELVKEQNSSLILVTHDKRLASQCDKIYALERGTLQQQEAR